MDMVNGMRPIRPGEILRQEFLVPIGLSANALALALRVPAPRINDIARERRAISADTALQLARYFGTSTEFWLGLQADFDSEKGGKRGLAPLSPFSLPRCTHHLG